MPQLNTQKELATQAKVGHDTVWKVKQIEEKAPEELKEKCWKARAIAQDKKLGSICCAMPNKGAASFQS